MAGSEANEDVQVSHGSQVGIILSQRLPDVPRFGGSTSQNTGPEHSIASFPLFGELPRELQERIWQHALIAEAKHTIVVEDRHGLIPSIHLISKVLRVCRAAYAAGDRFYDTKFDIYACIRLEGTRVYGPVKGVLRINFKYTTLLTNSIPRVWHLWGSTQRINNLSRTFSSRYPWESSRPPYPINQGLLQMTRSYITATPTRAQMEKVERVYELHEPMCSFSTMDRELVCCATCKWFFLKGGNPRLWPPVPRAYRNRCDRSTPVPNAWLFRYLVIGPHRDPKHLMFDYACLRPEVLWEEIQAKLVTCWDYPIRPIGDDFEPASQEDEAWQGTIEHVQRRFGLS